MSINAIGSCGSTSSVLSAQGTQAASSARGRSAFEAVSDVLGMSADDIASAVRSGSSLLDLAKEQGVSSDDLVSALKENAPAEMRSGADFDAVITKIASQKGGPGGPGGPGSPPPGPPPTGVASGNLTDTQSSTLDLLSELLDVDSDDLTSAIQNGNLTDYLQSKGVDLDDVATALEDAFAGSTTGFQVDLQA